MNGMKQINEFKSLLKLIVYNEKKQNYSIYIRAMNNDKEMKNLKMKCEIVK